VAKPKVETFDGAGGVDIHLKWWAPRRVRSTKGMVVIAHGGGEHSGRYQHVADRFTSSGYGVFAVDHRGHGESGGKPGLIDRMSNATADLGTVVAKAREKAGDEKPVFLLAHSLGGAIGLEYALDNPGALDGLVLSAPLAKLEAANPIQLAAARVVSVVAPATPVFKVDSSTISRDEAVVKAYDEDPLVLHKGLPARTVTEVAGAIGGFEKRLPLLEVPLLVMVGDSDKLVPPDAGRMVEELAGSEDKEIIEYHELFHEILNEPEQAQVLDDLLEWLDLH
jgi:alpha-beta hydrolase superfamily lysophospholipase